MKRILFLLCAFLLIGTASANAYTIVVDQDTSDSYVNPQEFTPSNPDTEAAWLAELLDIDASDIYFYLKDDGEYVETPSGTYYDDDGELFDDFPTYWEYAILKFANFHLAIYNDDEISGIIWDDLYAELSFAGTDLENYGLPENLSHVSYFGTAPVPEPATMLLLGTGLLGTGLITRRRRTRK